MKTYQLSPNVTIIHADNREMLPEFSSSCWILTDPPYGINYSHSGCGKGIGDGRYASKKLANWKIPGDDEPFDPSPFLRFEKVVLWGANHYSDKLPSSANWWIWDKFLSASHLQFSEGEMAWTNIPGNVRLFRHVWNGMMKSSEHGIPRVYPTQKPIALMDWCLTRMKATPENTVIDPHQGSGTTGVACIRKGIPYIGIDISEKAIEIALERLGKETQLKMSIRHQEGYKKKGLFI